MLTKIFKYIFFLSLCVGVTACGDDLDTPKKELIPDSPGTVTLRFRNFDRTRSPESDSSETLIENLFVTLYPLTADENSGASAVGRFVGLAEHTSSTVTMQLTEEMITSLFNDVNGASCRMYVLANVPSESLSKLSDTPTINEMKNLEVSAPFKTQRVQDSFVMAGEGTVTYTAGVTANDPGNASGSADMYRAAAKIRLNISLPESITVTNDGVEEIWVPENAGIQCLLTNGVSKAIASPAPASSEDAVWEPSSDDAYYDLTMSDNPPSVRTLTNSGTGAYPYVMDVPFYSFPNAWEESPSEQHKTTITLQVAWGLQPAGGGRPSTYHTYYYQVPVTSPELPHIDRNYSYNVNLTVGMLGSLVPETPLELDPLSYQVVNWSNEPVGVEIHDFRYLVVNPNHVSVQNEAEVSIPIYSSHPVDLSNITMTFQRFNFYTGTNGEVVDITIPQNKLDLSKYTVNGTTYKMVDYELKKDATTNQLSLVIKHPLEIWTPVNNNSANITALNTVNLTGNAAGTFNTVINGIDHFNRPTNPESPYSAYTFNVHIAHDDNAKYSEDITVIQYPAMYIEAKRNPGGGNNNKGNVWVNGANGTGGDFGGVHGISSTASNKNPNMYVINISQLDVGSEFIIGDPRMSNINNNLQVSNYGSLTTQSTAAASWDTEATSLYYEGNSKNRHLSYYYPTEEVAQTDPKGKMIAPKIRIASSYGVTNRLYRNNARRRVAVYQEVDRPAGRWRLPTYSELLYIIRLSSSGKIPMLFNHYPNGNNTASDCYYWTAQGLYRVNSDATLTKVSNSNSGGVKGIYDEWYWENSQYNLTSNSNGNYTYTLGDVPRGKQ